MRSAMVRRMYIGRLWAATMVGLLPAMLAPIAARAEEGGSAHYLPGATASFIDALPGKPGWAVANLFTVYNASAGGGRTLELGGQLTLGADATVFADTVAAIYTSKLELLGGNYSAGLAIPFVWMDIDGSVTGPGGGSLQVSDSANGIGDITLYPFMLGWVKMEGQLKYDVRLGVYAPTGNFDSGSLANVGKNYWTFEPSASVSYLNHKIGLEVTAFAGFDFNTENNSTNYQSGHSFHLDTTVAEHIPLLGGLVGFGANAFYYQQITGDSGSGAQLGDFIGHSIGVGPALSYATKLGKEKKIDFAAEIKWLPEIEVDKRLKGDYVWFKLAFSF